MQRRLEVVPLVLLLLAGCHHYVEVPRSALQAGDAIRVTLTRDAIESIAASQGFPGLQQQVDGEFRTEENADAFGILVRRRDASPADRSGLNAYLEVPWSSVERVEEKRLSPRRAAGITAIAGITTAVILSQTTGGKGSGEGEPPVNERVSIPLFRLLIR